MIKYTTFAAMVATVALAAGVGLSGCGPVVPANPTWAADVHPLLIARCIRCHDSVKRGDPGGIPAPSDFNLATAAEGAPLRMLLPMVVRGPMMPLTKTRMPPPPAEALADWEIQILDNWSKENPAQ